MDLRANDLLRVDKFIKNSFGSHKKKEILIVKYVTQNRVFFYGDVAGWEIDIINSACIKLPETKMRTKYRIKKVKDFELFEYNYIKNFIFPVPWHQ